MVNTSDESLEHYAQHRVEKFINDCSVCPSGSKTTRDERSQSGTEEAEMKVDPDTTVMMTIRTQPAVILRLGMTVQHLKNKPKD